MTFGDRKVPMKRGDTPLNRSKRISPRSKKTQQLYVERRKLVAEMLEGMPRCEMRPGCTRIAVCLHERWQRGRSGDTAHAILCRANVVRSCAECNSWASDHPAEAEELGIITPSWRGCACGHGRTST